MNRPNTALVIVDVQNDFVEGGALGVDGGRAVAERIEKFLWPGGPQYATVVASRDFHSPHNDNGGHFADEPDFKDTWPAHCVQGTEGAEYALHLPARTLHVVKGDGEPAYSVLDGRFDQTGSALRIAAKFHPWRSYERVDVVGIATDYCVKATVLDLLKAGANVQVIRSMVAGVAEDTTREALETMRRKGAKIF